MVTFDPFAIVLKVFLVSCSYNYIPENLKFRGYYVFGSAAAACRRHAAAVSAAARQRLYRP